jgi:hypothetical protein
MYFFGGFAAEKILLSQQTYKAARQRRTACALQLAAIFKI